MTEPGKDLAFKSPEKTQPSFEPVSATVPLKAGGEAQFLAYRFTSGKLAISNPIQEGLDISQNERVVRYVRSADAIIRIDPDGHMRKLDLKEVWLGVPFHRDAGYLFSGSSVEIGSPFTPDVGINPEEEIYLTNIRSTEELTKEPVVEVLIRTSRPVASDQLTNLPKTDTAAIFATPKKFKDKVRPLKGT